MSINFWESMSGFCIGIGIQQEEVACRPGKHYVYVHKGNGEIFYVGKGTGGRAFSKDRQPEWHYWVENLLGNEYSVEIVAEGISEEDALRIEDDLLRVHANTVINLQNMYAPYDSAKLLAYSHSMQLYDKSYKQGQKLQKAGNVEKAIPHYYEAYRHYVQAMQYNDYPLGARSQLPKPRYVPTQLLDHLSKCLVKQNKYQEVVKLYAEYVADFGEGDSNIEVGLKRRSERAAKKEQP